MGDDREAPLQSAGLRKLGAAESTNVRQRQSRFPSLAENLAGRLLDLPDG
jgi:hypothetical protein